MYGPGTEFAKNCAENVYLEFYEDIYGSHVSLKREVLAILSLGCSFPQTIVDGAIWTWGVPG